jgi:predicted dehydrogenase
MESGIIGTMHASWTYYGPEDNSTILYGKKGIMRIYDDPNCAINVFLDNGEKMNFDVDKIQTNENQTKSGVIDLFIESIMENKDTELSGKEALSAMRAVFASIESSDSGNTVAINQD